MVGSTAKYPPPGGSREASSAIVAIVLAGGPFVLVRKEKILGTICIPIQVKSRINKKIYEVE